MPWSVIGFWNAAIGFFIMRFARDPVATVLPSVAASARRRADHRLDRDHDLRPQRAARPGDPQSRRHDAGDRRSPARPARFHLYVLSDTSHERHRRARRSRLRRARRAMARPHPGHLPPPRRQHRLQGRKFLGLLRALGRPARIRRHARHRQLHDRRGDHADGARHAGRSEARHPAGPGGRPALDQRVRAHLPVRHAARHALMDDRQRLVAGRLRTRTGATTPSSASRRSSRIATSRSCRKAACSAAMC